jgi:hypothetical protein
MPSRMLTIASLVAATAFPGLVLSDDPSQFPLGQSADPGLKVNPNAQGATASVTPNSGPNG